MSETNAVLNLIERQIADDPRFFTRLVLIEAVKFGMPGKVAAMLDDLAAMLGLYPALPPNQLQLIAAPLIAWQTSADQVSNEHLPEAAALAHEERVRIAFGAFTPGALVGPAQIVVAMGNTKMALVPEPWADLFRWAACHVQAVIQDKTVEAVATDNEWTLIPDAEVLQPGGRLYQVYIECATAMRREALANFRANENDPRALTRKLAVELLDFGKTYRQQAIQRADHEAVARAEAVEAKLIATIDDFARSQTRAEGERAE